MEKRLLAFLFGLALFASAQSQRLIADSQAVNSFTVNVLDKQNIFDSLFISEPYYVKDYRNATFEQTDVVRENSSFYFKGNIAYPAAIRIWGEKGNFKFNELVFVDSGYQSFEISLINNKVSLKEVSSSNIQKEYRHLLGFLKMEDLADKNDYTNLAMYIKRNPQSYVGLFIMIDKVFFNGFNDFWRAISAGFDEKIKATKAYKYFSSEYLVGKKINPMVLVNSNGEKITKQFLPEDKNKNLVILLWFANCKPCIAEMQHLSKKYPFKNYEIVSVCTDSFTVNSKAKAILKKNKIKWPNYWDHQGEKFSEYIKLYSYPFNIVVDSARNIIGKHYDVNSFQ
ncbi:MAG: TlpA family protein disulfide reductase [Sediminibacterium sp.]|nr:TlpA family protein disulfide reductase [Sediminibacterium sp.]